MTSQRFWEIGVYLPALISPFQGNVPIRIAEFVFGAFREIYVEPADKSL